jgi:hypothetical protein
VADAGVDRREVDRTELPRTSAMIAIARPRSPTRLATNALLAALAYGGFQFQKPMSR